MYSLMLMIDARRRRLAGQHAFHVQVNGGGHLGQVVRWMRVAMPTAMPSSR